MTNLEKAYQLQTQMKIKYEEFGMYFKLVEQHPKHLDNCQECMAEILRSGELHNKIVLAVQEGKKQWADEYKKNDYE